MPGNIFIKFVNQDGKFIAGESQQTGHAAKDGWLEINDWSWDIENDSNFLKGTGASVGKGTPGPLTFSHTYDKSSPVIMKMIAAGSHFKTAQIDMLKLTGKNTGEPELFFQIFMKEVYISKVGSKGGEDGSVTQDVDMVFKQVNIGYKKQGNDGKLAKAEIPFAWNISDMSFDTHADIKLKFPASA